MAGNAEADEFLKEFLFDSYENLNRLDNDLLALEKDPHSQELLASIFRAVHTIKGCSGMLGFARLEAVTHAGENLLSRLRDRRLNTSSEIISALLSLIDVVRAILKQIETHHNEGSGDYSALIARFTALQAQEQAAAASNPALQATPAPALEQPDETRGASVTDSTIRVDVGLLDTLMNLVGELVLARNQVLQISSTHKDSALAFTTQRLNLITSELQEHVMKTRMQPIGNLWNKLPRIVRDLAHACGKQVRIELDGEATELDRTIVEAIKDPLTHIVRNAIDHGIEAPAARTAAGKPAEGRLRLLAFHEGGQVIIEVSDDGAGIDLVKVRDKALRRGLIGAEQAGRMSQRELTNLIFLPGFSTAQSVTQLSGRGVGMDVVKTNIEKIGGTVDIQTRPGHGTVLRLKIPLTLAIIPALIVSSGDDRFAIPQVSLLELVRLDTDSGSGGIELIHNVAVYRLRGQLLPLVYMNEILGLSAPERARATATHIIVLQAEQRSFGLVVDGVNDTEDIVVKPLGKQLKGLSTYAGATIMGDGRVALILDILGIAQRASVINEVTGKGLGSEAQDEAKESTDAENRQTLLLLANGADDRMAVPLSLVARLEKFSAASVEHTGSQPVVQYRNQIMPLLSLQDMLGSHSGAPAPASGDGTLNVVVYARQGRSIGLVVNRIIDIVEETVVLQRQACRRGVRGSAIVHGRVTELLDIDELLETFDPEFSGAKESVNA